MKRRVTSKFLLARPVPARPDTLICWLVTQPNKTKDPGGSISFKTGMAEEDFGSGDVSVVTANSGAKGVSGSYRLATGTTSRGMSGSISIRTGHHEWGDKRTEGARAVTSASWLVLGKSAGAGRSRS